MSEKIAQGKAGIVATKKSDPVIVSNALLTDSQSKSGSNESLASEMETVIIQGTDFAKEFEKPNDRASHIKIGRAKQKVISGGQGSILQCTSVSSVASGNAGKTTATPQKTATKPPDGPCRTSDLEGSAGSNSCAVKSALKKVTPTGTASVTAPAKTGHVASKANVNVSSKSGNIANANKPNNMLSRPTPPVAVSGRPVEVAANIGHRPNFPNMRSTIQAPAGVFPGAVQPRGRGPGTNFNPQRPASRMHANLFNAGRPNVQVVNVRNPRSMTPSSGYGAVRPALGITRPTGPMPVRLASGCPVNKMDVRRPNAANSTVRQRPLVPDKPSVKPCLNSPTKPGIPEANKINSMNNAVESGRKNAEKLNPVNKTSPHPVTTKIGCAGSVSASIKPTENAVKACNHTTTKPVDNVSLGSNKSCSQGGSSSSNSNISNTVKTSGKPVTTNPPQSGSNQLFKVSSNNTTGNKTVKPTNPDALETTKTQTPAQPPPPPPPPPSSSTCDNVDVLPSQPSTASEKEQNVADSAGTCDNDEALEDVEGSKGGISFSFNRKMGQKLPSSVPFGKEEEKAPNSADTEKDSKTEAVKEESCTEKSQDSNKEMPSAGMSFLKVLNKEQTLELDWPVEMIRYTKTEPSISYSCNPLFFDFKELLSKDKCHKEENTSSNQMKKKSDGDASVSKTEPNNADEKEKETKNQVNADSAKAEKSLVKKSRKKKRKLSSQRHTDEDEMKSKKKKKKKHSSKKREVKSEGGISEKEEDKNAVDVSKNKRHKKKKKRSHHLGPKSDLEQGHGEGGDGDGVTKSKISHKSKHKKHKSRKSKKKRHKYDEFEKDSNSGHESEEDLAASAVTEQKNKKHKKKKPPQAGKDSSNFSSEDELSKVASSGIAGEKVIAGEPDGKLATVAVCEEEKDVSKKRNVAGNNPTQTLESVDESKKTKKDEAGAAKPGSCTERKRPTGELDSPVGSKKKKLSSKNMCLKSEDTWSKMETIFEARSDPEGNKASWDTSSDSDVASHENKPNIKSKSADAGKRKKLSNPSEPSEKPENNPNPASKTSGSAVKVEPNNSSGSESDRPASAKQIYKRKKSYSGESHHSDSHCRSRDRSYSSSYSDRDSHYSDKSKHRHSRSHSSSRSRSRSRSASYERHSSRRGRRYSYSSYSDEDYRYRRGHSRSRSCSRRRSRTRSRSYSRSRRYRSYSSEHHRSYSSSSSRSRSRSESRGRSRSYSYSRSHSKSTSYSRSRSRSRSYHKSHSRSRSPHKSSKQDYRHKSSPEHRYYSSKKNSKHVSGGKGENEKGGKLDPAKIPLPIMPGDDKEEAGEGPEKSKDKMFPADTTKVSTPAAVTPGPEVAPTLHAVRKEVTVAGGGTGEPEAKSGLINIPLPPFQVAENAQLGKVDSVDGQLRPPPPPPHMLSMTHYTNTGDCLMHHPIPDLSQPPPSASLMANCPPPPPPPPPPMLNNNNNSNIPGMPATRLGAPSLYGHLSIPPQDVPRMNAPPPPPPPKCGVDSSMKMPLPFTPRSVTRLEQSSKENPSVSKSPIESTLQAPSAAATVETAEKEMTPPLPPPKSPPPQPPPPPKKEDEKKNCEEISPMQPIIPPEQVEQYKHLQEMAQKHAMKQQRRQRLKDTGQAEESDDDESMEMEGQVSTMVSDEECEEQPGILALPEPEPQHLQQQILLPHAQHAGSPVIAQHVVPFSQQQIIIPPSSLLQSQGAAFPIQTGGPMIAIPHTAAAHHHHHHPHHPLAGHHALHHAFHPAAAAGVPLAAAAASHPFHHQLIAAAPSQLVPYSSPQPILTQLHPPGPIIIGHQILIPRFPRAPM